MTHCMLTMLVAVLLQPPAPPVLPAKPQPAPEVKLPNPSEWRIESRDEAERLVVMHPDIRIAEARLMEAKAALDQAKLKVAIESKMNQAKYDQAKADVATKTKEFERMEAAHKSGKISVEEYARVVGELQTVKRQLAFAELFKQAEKEATQAPKGVSSWSTVDARYTLDAITSSRWLDATYTTPPAQSQSLHDLLQRKVKFAVKATDLDQTVIGVLERSMKEWDFASAKVIVRYPHDTDPGVRSAYTVQPVEGENTIGVWLLMMLDDYNAPTEQPKGPSQGKYQIYVRDYGLLFTLVKNAPDGAPTLAEFLRQPKK